MNIYNKSCRDMSELPDESVQCVVTSPPYWGLRKYSGNQEEVWGDSECQHEWIDNSYVRNNDKTAGPVQRGNKGSVGRDEPINNALCRLCGAWRGAFGLEPTLEMYVQHTVEILREIRRVLRSDGCCFLNLGDSYAGSGSPGGDYRDGNRGDDYLRPYNRKGGNLKPKDLCLIPFRVAIAAQEDGWWVRSVIIWNKPNPMPESVRDRPTESHEYILMLTKSARYFYDQEAVREKADYDGRKDTVMKGSPKYANGFYTDDNPNSVAVHGHERWPNQIDGEPGRNLRSVWTFPTQPFPGAHFAVFPEALPERCIKAATPEVGCCSKCGSPWVRVVEHKNMVINKTDGYAEASGNRTATAGTMVSPAETQTIGWQPTCQCGADKVGSLVLDPFAGSGTTLKVAEALGRQSVGYETSKEYCAMIEKRKIRSDGKLRQKDLL